MSGNAKISIAQAIWIALLLPATSGCLNNNRPVTPEPAPTKVVSTDPFDELLKTAQLSKKPVLVVFGFGRCSWCKKFALFLRDSIANGIISKHFEMIEFDIDRSARGQDLFRSYNLTGFPAWCIVDATGRMLLSNEAPTPGVVNQTHSIGYPSKPKDIRFFLNTLKKAAPQLKTEELENLRFRLEYWK